MIHIYRSYYVAACSGCRLVFSEAYSSPAKLRPSQELHTAVQSPLLCASPARALQGATASHLQPHLPLGLHTACLPYSKCSTHRPTPAYIIYNVAKLARGLEIRPTCSSREQSEYVCALLSSHCHRSFRSHTLKTLVHTCHI